MSEEKTYVYNFECSNCQKNVQLQIPLGTPVSSFITEDSLSPCPRCGCNPLTAISPLNR